MVESSSVQELVSMGYTAEQSKQALRVAAGDLEQAVGFLLMGDQSQAQLAETLGNSLLSPTPSNNRRLDNIGGMPSMLASPTGSTSSTPGAFEVKNDKVDELIQMGYSRQAALNALSVAHGDMDQAVSFLLMGESRTGFVLELESSFRFEDDAALAFTLQEDELGNASPVAATTSTAAQNTSTASQPRSSLYHPTSMRANSDVPKVVATNSFLATPGAAPFCACMAASKFLGGGVVNAVFLNEILAMGVELFRKNNSLEYDVGQVLEKYGKSPMRIQGNGEPMRGCFMPHDLSSEYGLRKRLAHSRNHQPDGWQLLILEIPNFEAFCIAIPPKGTKNKFWYLDFSPRSCFREVPGAYARVHSSLLQLEESLEAIFRLVCRKKVASAGGAPVGGAEMHETFNLYTITRARN